MAEKENLVIFKTGDAVVHPLRGAGVITGFKEFSNNGRETRYYKIKLFDAAQTRLMIPIEQAEERGLRLATPRSDLGEVWDVLEEDPNTLAKNHRTRYKKIEDKLQTGDILQVAEAVRDISWRRRKEDNLTVKGRRLYKRAMRLLAGEVAASQGIDLETAQNKIRTHLRDSFEDVEEE
jgi:CarD family transcriptional regulator